MTKTILLFPGTDSLEDPNLRLSAIQIPEVFEKLKLSQQILGANGFGHVDLMKFMKGQVSLSENFFVSLTSATVAVQVAMFEKYLGENTRPDLLLGCSMGDAAKSIVMGSVEYSTGLINMTQYITEILKVQAGAVLRLKITSPDALRTGAFPLPGGIYWSVLQTPNHALVGGHVRDLKKWSMSLDPRIAQAKMLYPFPLHTPLMQRVADKFSDVIAQSVTKTPAFPTLSTVTLKKIETKADLVEDLTANITCPVRWWEAVEELGKQGYNEVVNLGPASTLLKFNKFILSNNFNQRDYFQEVMARAASIRGDSIIKLKEETFL